MTEGQLKAGMRDREKEKEREKRGSTTAGDVAVRCMDLSWDNELLSPSSIWGEEEEEDGGEEGSLTSKGKLKGISMRGKGERKLLLK